MSKTFLKIKLHLNNFRECEHILQRIHCELVGV